MAKNGRKTKNKSYFKRIATGVLSLALAGAVYFYMSPSKPITLDKLRTFEGVEAIVDANSETPKNIVVLQDHPNQNTVTIDSRNIPINMKPVLQVFDQLYSRGLRDIIVEGTSQNTVDNYNKNPASLNIPKSRFDPVMANYQTDIQKVLKSHNWRLHTFETKEVREAQDKLIFPLKDSERKILDNLRKSLELQFEPYEGRTISRVESMRLEEAYKELIRQADVKISNLVYSFFTPNTYSNFMDITVNQRETNLNRISEGINGQVGILIGAAHGFTLTNRLNGTYAFVLPEGITKKPEYPSIDMIRRQHMFNVTTHPFEYILRKNRITVEKK